MSGLTVYVYDYDYGTFDGIEDDLLASGVTDEYQYKQQSSQY